VVYLIIYLNLFLGVLCWLTVFKAIEIFGPGADLGLHAVAGSSLLITTVVLFIWGRD